MPAMNESIARYEKMVAEFPQNELGRFSLGKALFDAGEFRRAKEHLEIALAKKPDWMVVQILIGKCELALGNRASAQAAFEGALQLAIEQHHDGPQAEMEQALADLKSQG
jgi:predicted Zn-dependent protease